MTLHVWKFCVASWPQTRLSVYQILSHSFMSGSIPMVVITVIMHNKNNPLGQIETSLLRPKPAHPRCLWQTHRRCITWTDLFYGTSLHRQHFGACQWDYPCIQTHPTQLQTRRTCCRTKCRESKWYKHSSNLKWQATSYRLNRAPTSCKHIIAFTITFELDQWR